MNELIVFWNNEIIKNPIPEIYEAAFLRLYIEHEKFIMEMFKKFCIGESYSLYRPSRKLSFIDEIQLADIISGEARFVDYVKAIPRCSKHIFEKDPFGFILSARNIHDDLHKMKIIRDYLAHRSNEAAGKYKNNVLDAYNINKFIAPGDFLKRKMNRKSLTFYSYYCSIFSDMVSFFKNDALLASVP